MILLFFRFFLINFSFFFFHLFLNKNVFIKNLIFYLPIIINKKIKKKKKRL